MIEPVIKKVSVWSARLRWTHAAMNVSIVILFFTAWVTNLEIELSEVARGYHYLAGIALTFTLAYRFYLLFFGTKSERVEDSLMTKKYAAHTKNHLRFYLSLGKSELSDWYAHNPFWGPIYLVFFVVSTIMVITGFAIGKLYFGSAVSLSGIHQFGAVVVLVFAVLHIAAVILHDIKAENAVISAMLSGNKYFSTKPDQVDRPKEVTIKFSANPLRNKKDSGK